MTMTRTLTGFTTALVLACVGASPAAAGPQEDFSFELKQQTHDSHRPWVIDKFVTLNLGKACWAKVNDKKNRALGIATSITREVADYAKGVTGNDWSKIEGQSANSAEANRKLVEKMMDDFRPSLHITVTVEGDDCDTSGNALWLKYWGETVRALKANPPKGGKAQITVNVTSKAKGVAVEVRDGSVFTITGSRDVEASGWGGEIQKAFQRVSGKS
jgi:hypothetical protein